MQTMQGRGVRASAVVGCWLVFAPVAAAQAVDRRPAPAPRVVPGLVLESSRGAPDAGPRLEPIGDGRLRHRGKGFTAIVDADGSVEFREGTVEAKVNILGFDLQGNRRPPANLARDNFEERALYPNGPPTAPMMVAVGGGFGGIVGALIAKVIQRRGPGKSRGDRHTAAKLAFLRDTGATRMRMTYAWLKARLATQLDLLISQVLAVWRDPSVAMVERRRRIFVMWDECEESGPASESAVEQIRGEAAALARARIEALVRLLAPAGSPRAYGADELARLNATRRSRRAFDPYGDSTDEAEALEQPTRDDTAVPAAPP